MTKGSALDFLIFGTISILTSTLWGRLFGWILSELYRAATRTAMTAKDQRRATKGFSIVVALIGAILVVIGLFMV